MYIVIMAGGSGTRFWPMSRASYPKQFLTIVGDKPMVTATYDRVRKMTSADRVVFVVGEVHREETERLFAAEGAHILVEPKGRNTAPCIGAAAGFIDRLGGGDEPVVILPADHYIARPDVFREALVRASDVALGGGIATLGIVPTRPETGYGYIECESSPVQSEGVLRARRFVEKPDFEKAATYLQQGGYYWNAGIFVATPKVLLEEFAAHMPGFHAGLTALAPTCGAPGFSAAMRELYEGAESISFDYAIMEKTSRPLYVIPCDCGWSDVGSWYSLYEVRKNAEQDKSGNVVEGEALLHECRDSFVISRGKRLVAALGLEGVLVVDAEDALLVADLRRSQEVKQITEMLKEMGLKKLL
jgi:mannose-1-phosphate guanylyltransferase